jgi:hypothetical protein
MRSVAGERDGSSLQLGAADRKRPSLQPRSAAAPPHEHGKRRDNPMVTEKRTINLTDDNWADYLPDDYPASLVEGLAIGDDGIERDGAIVTKLLAWLARASGRSTNTRFEMTRHDAAVLLEHLAGWPDCLREIPKKREKG